MSEDRSDLASVQWMSAQKRVDLQKEQNIQKIAWTSKEREKMKQK